MGGGAADKYMHKYRNIHEFIPSVQVIVEGHAVMIYKHMEKKLPDRKTIKTNNRNFVSFLFLFRSICFPCFCLCLKQTVQ